MVKHILLATSLLAAAPAFADGTDMPESLRQTLNRAMATGDSFIINATVESAQKSYPQWHENIESFIEKINTPETKTANTPKATIEEKSPNKPTQQVDAPLPSWMQWIKGWDGTVEGGLEALTGNTHRRTFNGGINLNREWEKWRLQLGADGEMTREDHVRTEENYTISAEGDYKLSERDYVFASAEYVTDAFSGLDYRLTESVGYGRTVIKKKDISLDIKGAVGARHSQPSQSTKNAKNHEFVAKPEAEFKWQITDNLKFSQNAKSTIGQEVIVSEATTSLTNKLTSSLYLKGLFELEHVSEVPENNKRLDTKTLFNLVYEF